MTERVTVEMTDENGHVANYELAVKVETSSDDGRSDTSDHSTEPESCQSPGDLTRTVSPVLRSTAPQTRSDTSSDDGRSDTSDSITESCQSPSDLSRTASPVFHNTPPRTRSEFSPPLTSTPVRRSSPELALRLDSSEEAAPAFSLHEHLRAPKGRNLNLLATLRQLTTREREDEATREWTRRGGTDIQESDLDSNGDYIFSST